MTPQELADQCLRRARAAMEVGRPEEGERQARQALVHAPDDAEAHGLLGQSLVYQARYAEAQAAAEAGLKSMPDAEWLHRMRSITLRHQGRLDEALEAADTALRCDPDEAYAHYARSTALEALRRLDEAEASARTALELSPEDARFHRQLGDVLLERDPAGAERAYRDSLRLEPHSAVALNNLGVAMEKQHRLAEAATAYKSAILADPTFQLAKDNARSAVRQHLKVGAGFLFVGVLLTRAVLRLFRDRPGADHLVMGGFALLVAVSYVGYHLWRRAQRKRELQQSDPQLLAIYEQLERDAKRKPRAA